MTPYYERSGITIYHGDALEVLPQNCERLRLWRTESREEGAAGHARGVGVAPRAQHPNAHHDNAEREEHKTW